MKFRFEQKVIYRDLDPFVIISLWVFAVSLQFSYAIKWDHNICHRGRRGRRNRLQGGEGSRKCGVLKKNTYIIPCIVLKAQQNVFTDTKNSGFNGICRLKLGSFICFWASLFNIHKYLLNRPKWFHIERWYWNKSAVREALFQQRKAEQQDLQINILVS